MVRAGVAVQLPQEDVQRLGDGEIAQGRRSAAREATGETARDGHGAPEGGEQGFGALEGEGPFAFGAGGGAALAAGFRARSGSNTRPRATARR